MCSLYNEYNETLVVVVVLVLVVVVIHNEHTII